MRRLRSFITKPVVNPSDSLLGKDAPASRGPAMNRAFSRTAVGLFLLLAIISLSLPLVGQAAAPTVSHFTINAQFISNSTFKAGKYELTMAEEKITIKRSNTIIYTQSFKPESKPAYLFYGPDSNNLLIKETRTTATEVYFDLWLVNLALKKPAKFSLQSNHFPIKAAPQLFVILSPDNGKMVFSYFGTNLKNSKFSKLQDLKINSSQTGAVLSIAGPFTPAGPVIAETTSTGVKIRLYNTRSTKDGGEEQPLQVSPTLLDFGRVTAGSSSTLHFTITNTGATDVNYAITFLSSSPSSAFTFSPSSGVIAIGADVNIDVTLAPPADLAAEANYSEDLSIIPNNNPDQKLMVWIFGTGVIPTPTPTPTPTSRPAASPILTPGPTTRGVVYPDFRDIPQKIYALFSFPVPLPTGIFTFPTKIIKPTKYILKKTKPDWDGIRALLTSDAEINGMSIDDFITSFEDSLNIHEFTTGFDPQCISLLMTEIKVSQNSNTVTSSFKATVRYKKPLSTSATTVTQNGILSAHFRKNISWLPKWPLLKWNWRIDNLQIKIKGFKGLAPN
ncbi:MAG TPA: hypothetical protein VHY08_18520 [Bacillota bacterium]|nr:hypothetical protein [Bacillota bacterium]